MSLGALEGSWQHRAGLLGPWERQGKRLTQPPHKMPIWSERDWRGRAMDYTLCVGCKTVLRLRDAPRCGTCRTKIEAARRSRRKARKRAAVRQRLGAAV